MHYFARKKLALYIYNNKALVLVIFRLSLVELAAAECVHVGMNPATFCLSTSRWH